MDKTVRVGVATIIHKMGKAPSILLGKRKGAHGAGTWSLPGGRIEHGEEPAETAIREVAEEIGLVLSSVVPFLSHSYNSAVIDGQHWITLVFSTRIAEGEPKLMEPDKCEEWRWFPLTQLPEPLFAPFDQLAIAMNWKFKNDLTPVV